MDIIGYMHLLRRRRVSFVDFSVAAELGKWTDLLRSMNASTCVRNGTAAPAPVGVIGSHGAPARTGFLQVLRRSAVDGERLRDGPGGARVATLALGGRDARRRPDDHRNGLHDASLLVGRAAVAKGPVQRSHERPLRRAEDARRVRRFFASQRQQQPHRAADRGRGRRLHRLVGFAVGGFGTTESSTAGGAASSARPRRQGGRLHLRR